MRCATSPLHFSFVVILRSFRSFGGHGRTSEDTHRDVWGSIAPETSHTTWQSAESGLRKRRQLPKKLVALHARPQKRPAGSDHVDKRDALAWDHPPIFGGTKTSTSPLLRGVCYSENSDYTRRAKRKYLSFL